MSTRAHAAMLSAGAGVLLVAAAILVPRLTGEDVRVHWPPLHAWWGPRLEPGIVGALVLGPLLVVVLPIAMQRLSWRLAVLTATAASWAWTMVLALADGPYGLSRVYERASEYLTDAREVDDVGAMLQEFISRIPDDAVDKWHTHVAGHPPGALLAFVGMDRVGLDELGIAIAVVTLGCTSVAAVMLTLDELGSRHLARRAGPWLALAPLAVWSGVSTDWMFAAVAAWGLYLLARAGRRGSVPAALGAGLLLGFCVFLSYGLVLLGVLALAVLWLSGRWSPLPWAAGVALAVAGAFALLGFAWWEAYPVLRERYYAGIASERAYSYWVWADLAAWTFTIGLATWAAFPAAVSRIRASVDRRREALVVLAGAGTATVVLAALSGMSKAEVERIWLPFTVWVVTLPALLPARWTRPLLAVQVVVAVVVQILLVTRW